jgi:hypothetical protein
MELSEVNSTVTSQQDSKTRSSTEEPLGLKLGNKAKKARQEPLAFQIRRSSSGFEDLFVYQHMAANFIP